MYTLVYESLWVYIWMTWPCGHLTNPGGLILILIIYQYLIFHHNVIETCFKMLKFSEREIINPPICISLPVSIYNFFLHLSSLYLFLYLFLFNLLYLSSFVFFSFLFLFYISLFSLSLFSSLSGKLCDN